MAIEFVCPACGGTLQVGDEAAGRVIRCGGCMTALRVPGSGAADPAPAAPDPYAVGRAYPPPPAPPPPPPRPEPAPQPSRDEPPATARPIAPRRRDPDDPDDRRRSRRRPPPPPPGKGVFFWLVIAGAILLVGTIGCCGGLFLLIPSAKWQDHESVPGKFKVKLPGPAQGGVEELAGLKLEDGAHSEGAIIGRRGEQFVVIYRPVAPLKERGNTDEREIDKAVEALKKATKAGQLVSEKPITVGGFPAREIEFHSEKGWYTARIVVADKRVYVLLAGGPLAKRGNANARMFLDSFEFTDEELVKEGKRRAEQAKLADEAAREAKEREAARRAAQEEDERRTELHDAAEAVAGTALLTARRTRPALPVAPPPHEPTAPSPRPVDD